jgi:hypothetical protein
MAARCLAGRLCHSTSSDAIEEIVRLGALRSAASLDGPARGEGLANPTVNAFVAFDDGDHPDTAAAQLLRCHLLAGTPGLATRPWVGRLLDHERDPHQRRVYVEALEAPPWVPDAGRARALLRAVAEVRTAFLGHAWIDRAIDHLREPAPYRLFPTSADGFVSRLVHDLLLELGYEPGGRHAASQETDARARLLAAEPDFASRLDALACRHRPLAQFSDGDERYGVILAFPRMTLLASTTAASARERRCHGPAGVPLRLMDLVLVPQARVLSMRTRVPHVEVLELESLEHALEHDGIEGVSASGAARS